MNFDLERWEFVNDDILPSLKLSYDQMPSYLKHCFAYSSLFPTDFGFAGAQISSLWAGLGLLRSPVGSRQVEHIAAQYIDELHSRSFLEDFEDFGHIYYFKLHDLALYVAKEDLLVVNLRTCNIPEQARHLSVVENDSLNHALFPRSRSVRTILSCLEFKSLPQTF